MAITVANTSNSQVFSYWLARTNELAYSMSTYSLTTDANANYTIAVGNSQITGTFTANNFLSGNSTVNVVISGTTSTITSNVVNTNNITINVATINSNLTVGNSSVNSSLNATTFKTTNAVFTNITSNTILVGNSSVNTYINTSSIGISNSTANLIITIPTAAQIANGQYYLNANGQYNLVSTFVYSPISNSQLTTSGLTTQVLDSFSMTSYKAAEYLLYISDNNNSLNYYTTKFILTHNGAAAFSTEYGSFVIGSSIGVLSSSSNATSAILNFTPTSSSTFVKFIRTIV